MVSEGFATLREMHDFYSMEDVYDMFEISTVNMINKRIRQIEASKKDTQQF